MIALDGVAKAYPTAGGRKIVLEEATVEFAPGHNFGILGANGAGKSTLIRLLAGSEMPDRGTISLPFCPCWNACWVCSAKSPRSRATISG